MEDELASHRLPHQEIKINDIKPILSQPIKFKILELDKIYININI